MSRPDLTLISSNDPAAQDAAAWYARLRADDVSEHDRECHLRWMTASPAHRTAYQRVERVWSSLGSLAHEPELERLMRPELAAPVCAAQLRRRFPAPRLAAAALLVAALAGSLHALRAPAPMAPSMTEYATAHGERRSIQLQDGTQMDLDASTHAQVRYSAQARTVTLLAGRAYFHVAREPGRPFEVVSAQGRARALGTQFETAVLADALDVALYEGRVALLTAGRQGQPPSPLGTLAPGQKARLRNARMALLQTGVETGGSPGWLTGNLVFNETPLAEAVAEFNRYSSRPIQLQGEAVRQLRISGVFRGSDAEGFVEALRDVYQVREQQGPDGSRVLSTGQ